MQITERTFLLQKGIGNTLRIVPKPLTGKQLTSCHSITNPNPSAAGTGGCRILTDMALA